MREIEFRAWDVKNKKYIASFAVINGHCYVEKNPTDNSYVEVFREGAIQTYYSSWATYQKIDATLEQYTGLKDKNDKKIYESDIVDNIVIHGDEYGIGIIVFEDGAFSIKIFDNKYMPCLYEADSNSIEVIGNIYDNKELLK